MHRGLKSQELHWHGTEKFKQDVGKHVSLLTKKENESWITLDSPPQDVDPHCALIQKQKCGAVNPVNALTKGGTTRRQEMFTKEEVKNKSRDILLLENTVIVNLYLFCDEVKTTGATELWCSL